MVCNAKNDNLNKNQAINLFLIFLAVCLIVPSVAFAVWWNPFTWFSNKIEVDVKNEQKPAPVKPVNNDKCSAEFQDFIKKYGSDYSKCLVDFGFNDDYCAGFNPDTQGLSDVNLIVILDASGSMSAGVDSSTRIDVAKKAVSNLLIEMPKGVNTGLVVYGHKGSNSEVDKNLSCKGIEQVVKLGANNSSNIISAMNIFSPKGWTPIAGSIDFAKDIFKNDKSSSRNYLILVSDGIESCGGDPIKAAENLKAEIPGIKLNIIGFTNDSATQEFLGKIAVAGDGSYLTAYNSTDFDKAFNDELLAIKKDCLSVTLFQLYSRNSANNVNNLNCWLTSYRREASNFTANVLNNSINEDCSLEISKTLQIRRNEFWYKKEALAEKNDIIYNKIESDFNEQLKALK